MKYSLLIFAVLILACGCRQLPTIRVKVVDRNGVGVSDLLVNVSSTEFVSVHPMINSEEERELFEEIHGAYRKGRNFEFATDSHGVLTISVHPPSEPGFWASLFGAKPPTGQSVTGSLYHAAWNHCGTYTRYSCVVVCLRSRYFGAGV